MDTKLLLLELRGNSSSVLGNELSCIYHSGLRRGLSDMQRKREAECMRACVCVCVCVTVCKSLKTWHEMKHLSFPALLQGLKRHL